MLSRLAKVMQLLTRVKDHAQVCPQRLYSSSNFFLESMKFHNYTALPLRSNIESSEEAENLAEIYNTFDQNYILFKMHHPFLLWYLLNLLPVHSSWHTKNACPKDRQRWFSKAETDP